MLKRMIAAGSGPCNILFYLGESVGNMERIEALRDECAHKREKKPSGRMGF